MQHEDENAELRQKNQELEANHLLDARRVTLLVDQVHTLVAALRLLVTALLQTALLQRALLQTPLQTLLQRALLQTLLQMPLQTESSTRRCCASPLRSKGTSL